VIPERIKKLPDFILQDSVDSAKIPAVEIAELAKALTALGCPAGKSSEMAAQLDKRAKQLAEQKGRSYEEALAHLLALMKQGWSAKEKGF
jgi:hypothetical protein